uniref:STAS domain-containing protein n=1 Tax=Macrostomum lignano TaxID=282301 RepID=A0A1I8FMF1_9PLAT
LRPGRGNSEVRGSIPQLRTALSSASSPQPSQVRAEFRHVCADLSLATGIDFAVVEALKTVRERLRLLSARLFVVARQPEVRQILEQAGLPVFESVQAAESGLSASAGASEDDAADHVTAGARRRHRRMTRRRRAAQGGGEQRLRRIADPDATLDEEAGRFGRLAGGGRAAGGSASSSELSSVITRMPSGPTLDLAAGAAAAAGRLVAGWTVGAQEQEPPQEPQQERREAQERRERGAQEAGAAGGAGAAGAAEPQEPQEAGGAGAAGAAGPSSVRSKATTTLPPSPFDDSTVAAAAPGCSASAGTQPPSGRKRTVSTGSAAAGRPECRGKARQRAGRPAGAAGRSRGSASWTSARARSRGPRRDADAAAGQRAAQRGRQVCQGHFVATAAAAKHVDTILVRVPEAGMGLSSSTRCVSCWAVSARARLTVTQYPARAVAACWSCTQPTVRRFSTRVRDAAVACGAADE